MRRERRKKKMRLCTNSSKINCTKRSDRYKRKNNKCKEKKHLNFNHKDNNNNNDKYSK